MASQQTHRQFPWKHVIGFALSIALTLLALWVALYSGLSVRTIVVVIVLLTVFQALMQLLMFMHMTESKSGWIQSGTMVYAAFIAIVIVAGSVWVMTSGHAEHDPQGEHGEPTEQEGQTESSEGVTHDGYDH